MKKATEFAEAYQTVVNFIGYAAGIGVGIGGEIGKKMETNAAKALDAVRTIRPMTAVEMDELRYEQAEKQLFPEESQKESVNT